jgi:poly-gamma-glutamate capsule biosynthesis protein CapA/YwtB (metallophosphatase superfamily)
VTRVLILLLAPMLLLASACASPAGAPEAPPTGIPITQTALATVPAVASATPSASVTVSVTPVAVATPAPPATGESITISAVGDISLARQVVDWMQAEGAAYPFALVAPYIDSDIGFGNLEGAFTDRGEPWPKGYTFRTPPQFAPALIAGHIGVVTLANNHIMDYGAIGLTDTVAALDAAGVQHVGAGAEAAAAHTAVIVTVRGLRVAFLGYVLTPTESGGFSITSWAAGPGTPGVAIGDAATIRADVAAARQAADFVVVAVHAGDEYHTAPNATQRTLAQAAMDAGADAYIGAHAHVVQPVERRGRQLIAWGLGNFVFDLDPVDLANIPAPRVSLILKITLTKGQGVTAYQAIPVTLDAEQDRPRPATTAEAIELQRLIAPG